MASPTYSAGSPPALSPLALPNRRPTLALPTGSIKSRKPSTASATSSTHPLRQTSFPPENSLERQHALAFSPGAVYSPDEDGGSVDFSDEEIMSAIGAPGDGEGSKKRKRGEKRTRGRPAKNAGSVRGGTASLVNGEDARSQGRRGAPTVVTADGEGGGDEDDEDMGEDEQLTGQDAQSLVDLAQESRRKAIFRNNLNPAHQERFDVYNRVKLRTGDVRRVVNQTLSQSVPPNVVTVVSAYAKLFAGMIVEEARQVQGEWMAVEEHRPDGGKNEAFERLSRKRKRADVQEDRMDVDASKDTKRSRSKSRDIKAEQMSMSSQVKQANGTHANSGSESSRPGSSAGVVKSSPVRSQTQSRPGSSHVTQQPTSSDETRPDSSGTLQASPQQASQKEKDATETHAVEDAEDEDAGGAQGLASLISPHDRGPLLPDHLREALRRYKKKRSGGTVGFTGLSLEGKEVAASRMGGRRLFR